MRFRHLLVWTKAHRFVLDVYRYSSRFPTSERYGLTSQLRRAAVSVPANIAEGYRRRTKPDKLRFFNLAESSLQECAYYLVLAYDLGYGSSAQLRESVEEIQRMLAAYCGRLASEHGSKV